jgi:hypothetical protein
MLEYKCPIAREFLLDPGTGLTVASQNISCLWNKTWSPKTTFTACVCEFLKTAICAISNIVSIIFQIKSKSKNRIINVLAQILQAIHGGYVLSSNHEYQNLHFMLKCKKTHIFYFGFRNY